MATTEVTLTGSWQAVHTSTADGTSVVVTPRRVGLNWAIDTDTPTVAGHILAPNQDREIFLKNTEVLYVLGKSGRVINVTVT